MISAIVMMDPVKQREMEVKVSQSQQKINEWHEELQLLQGLSCSVVCLL